MKERIDALQRLLWITLGLAVLLLIANATGGNNGPKMAALRELEGFAANFDRSALEDTLLERARAQVRVPLSQVAALTGAAPGVPELTAQGGDLDAAGSISLATLGALHDRRQASEATLNVVVVEELAKGLAFRLARKGHSGTLALTAIGVEPGGATDADRKRFMDAEAARRVSIETRKRFSRAEQKFERLDELLAQRRKWKASRKVISRTFAQRMEAKAERDALRKALDDAKAEYHTLAAAAEAFDGEAAPSKGDPGTAVARVSVQHRAAQGATGGGPQLTFSVPVAVRSRSIDVPTLDGVTFTETHAAGLWDAVKGRTPSDAVKTAKNAFGWHYSLPGGITLLHLWPLLILWLLFTVRRRTRAVSAGYDPYASRDAELPPVGTGRTSTDGLVLAALPAVACMWTAYSLAQVGQWPLSALAGGVGSLILGGLAVRDIQELRSLTVAVVASHSQPPAPLPDATATDPAVTDATS